MPLTRWMLLATTMLLIQQPALAKECIGVISAGSGNHFWRAVESGARKAGSELGYEIFYRYPSDESAIKEQVQLLNDAAKKNCVAIVLAPNSPTHITEIQAFNSQNTPVVIIDRDMQLNPVYAKVMTDNYRAGQLAAQQMIEALEDHGSVAVLGLQHGISSTDAREQGFIDTIRSSNIKLLPMVHLGTDIAQIRLNADRYLRQYLEEMDGLFTPNEMTTLGALAELRLKAKPGKIIHIGFDLDRYLLQGLSSGEISGLVLQQPYEMGYLGVKLAVDALNGKEKPAAIIYTSAYYLTKKKMDTPEGKNYLQLNTDEGSALRTRKASK